jgi:hypothetical protein
VNLWAVPRYREAASSAILALFPVADGPIAEAIMDVFRLADPLPIDNHTWDFLDALARQPNILRLVRRSFLPDRLKGLLAEGVEPERVSRLVNCLLDASGRDVADIRTAWAADAGDLIQIAITLQRFPPTRSQGLDLFERLMDLGAYGIDKVLRDNDRRFGR